MTAEEILSIANAFNAIIDERMALVSEVESLRQDKALLDWLEKQLGSGLISDDRSRWAVSYTGMQNVPGEKAADITTTFFIAKDEWRPTLRKAIASAMKGGAR